MPAGRSQSNATLYTLIAFVLFFIISTTFAVIYYAKFEEQRTTANTLRDQKNDLANDSEFKRIPSLIGVKKTRETYLGKMVGYLDQTVSLIIGGPLKETSAEVKVDDANKRFKETLELLAQEHIDIETIDPNTTGLLRIIEKLKNGLDSKRNETLALNKQLEELQSKFEVETAVNLETVQKLSAEKAKYKQQVDKIKQDYDDLKKLMQQTSEQRAQTLVDQRDAARTERDKMEATMLQTDAKLTIAQDRIAHLQKQIQAIMPPFDSNVPAYQPDGKIMVVDNQIVHLNIGSDDRVYQGLTFSVYNKGMPIPKEGKGKAEIEVFDVRKNVSAARITRSEIKRPIVVDDIVANLIWDSDKTNRFVVTGEFDLNSDGDFDYDAVDKIKSLIKGWGGEVADAVSIDTDFLVLGRPPQVRGKPTLEEMEVDPMAMEKHEASLQKLAHYNQVKSQAQALSIPIFNTERFLHFVGYKSQAGREGSF